MKVAVCSSSTLEEYYQREERLSMELERGRQRTEEVNQELGQVLEELGNARLDSQESRKQLQRKELLTKLRRLHPETVVRVQGDSSTSVLSVITTFIEFSFSGR